MRRLLHRGRSGDEDPEQRETIVKMTPDGVAETAGTGRTAGPAMSPYREIQCPDCGRKLRPPPRDRRVRQTIVQVLFSAAIIAGVVSVTLQVASWLADEPECRDEVVKLADNWSDSARCSHRHHTLLRESDDGLLWRCTCDPFAHGMKNDQPSGRRIRAPTDGISDHLFPGRRKC
jgi:hypothetical protein